MKATRTASILFLPVIPAVAAVATLVLYLGNWPASGGGLHPGRQLAIGFAIGVGAWLLATLGGHDLLNVEAASARTYEELRGRVETLQARLADLKPGNAEKPFGREAVDAAEKLVGLLMSDLHLAEGNGQRSGSPYRWVRGHGYVNAWRDVHDAEELLLTVEAPEVVYAAAVTNLDRIAGTTATSTTKATEEASLLTKELKSLVDGNGSAATKEVPKAAVAGDQPAISLLFPGLLGEVKPKSDEKSSEEKAVARCDEDWARAVVRESAHRIHRTENDAWDKIVNRRNLLLGGLALAVTFAYAVLVLIVLQPVNRTSVLTAASAFFLVGASVGVFKELYATSQQDTSTVFDYGLASARLTATPVLSGIAAVLGVVITNYIGSFLLNPETAGATTISVPPLADIFSLHTYPMGLVVAAIFGLTPGFLLDRLGARKSDYEKQIEDLSSGSTGGSGSTAAKKAGS